jgi:BlaI family penicillinase repressor
MVALDTYYICGSICYTCSRYARAESRTPEADVRVMRLSDTEWTVMRAVWARSPVTARDVLEQVSHDTGWAYTTVKTILARLVEKGALAEHKRTNTSLYEPRVTERAARISALRSLVDRAFDGLFGSIVQHLVSEERLSARERTLLRDMLAASEDDAAPPSGARSASAPAGMRSRTPDRALRAPKVSPKRSASPRRTR